MERLLGNERVRERLQAAFAADRLSHSYLISGPAGSGKHTLAKLLAAAMQCTEGSRRPCGTCLQCRKVFAGTHPDVITVDDPARKTVGVELIRKARADVYIRPNEGRRKIYVFPRAMDMNPSAQNALLKVIEEPPAYAAFLLLTEEAQRLLPTIRSRCVDLQMAPLSREVCVKALAEVFPDRDPQELRSAWQRSEGWYGRALTLLQANEGLAPETLRFARAFADRDRLAMTELLVPMERLKRDQLIPLLEQWVEVLAEAVSIRSGMQGSTEAALLIGRSRSVREILAVIQRLQQASELAQGNVSVGAICGALQIWLEAG